MEIAIENGKTPRWISMIIKEADSRSASITNKLFQKTDFKAAFIPMVSWVLMISKFFVVKIGLIDEISLQPNPDKVSVKGFAKKLKLHDYQQKAISWMNHIERAADDEVDYVRLMPWKGVATELLFETELNRACLARDFPEFTKQMSHKGNQLK